MLTPDAGGSLLLSADDRRMPQGLYRRVRSGELARVRPGVYAPADWWAALPPHERYRERVAAAVLVFPDAALMRESAAVAHGLPAFGEPRDIHFFDPDRRSTRRFGDVVVQASERPRVVTHVAGALATDLITTVVDTARHLPPAYALAVADTARSRGLHRESIRAHSLSDPNRRHERMLAWVWDFADARAESTGESVSRAVISWLGLPVPILQRTFFTDGHEDRPDFWWPDYSTIGESDGYGKYRAATAEAAVRGVVKEKLREDRLRRRCRSFTRWDWGDTHRVQPLLDKLLGAGLPQVGAPDRAMLATLRGARR
ncbi:hypothetical protein ACIGCK_03315 [Microbacterium sp. NPDC078428]|uniref:hypothetical protein n=1 Tax=Microbacterium sp. NPDC078428 TaxID=3364190 RepID=UPI0037C923EA